MKFIGCIGKSSVKGIFSLIFLSLICFRAKADIYYAEYPISIVVQTNASQQRLELSTFDSTLQTNVVAHTGWVSGYHLFNVVNGTRLVFTTWVNPGQQLDHYGYAIYDYVLHQFSLVEDVAPVSAIQSVNVVANSKWFVVGNETKLNPTSYSLTTYYYKYSMVTHTWQRQSARYPEFNNSPQIWNIVGPILSDWVYWIEDTDEGDLFFYNLYTAYFNWCVSGCVGWGYGIDEEHIFYDGNCLDSYSFHSGNPRFGLVNVSPSPDLVGGGSNGIFYGYDELVYHPMYIFTYDLGTQTTLVHSEPNPTAGNLVIKDRVITWTVASNGSSPMIYFMVHDPVQHAFILDSAVTPNVVTPSIINGTVHWTDANGSHIRGYNVNTGWGNYNTPLFMYFHLTDFATTDSIPLVHVRNYSIGEENFYYDMGDGSVTGITDNTWRLYDKSGNYNVCMYNATGTQSVCQTVTINSCSVPGVISSTADTICEGDTVTFSLSGSVGNVQWQYSLNQINWSNISSPGFDSTIIQLPVSTTAYYRARVTSSSCFPVNSVPLKVYVKPKLTSGVILTTPTAGCEGATVRLQMNGYTGGLQWQKNNGGGWVNLANGNNVLCNAVLNGNTDFRAIATISTPACSYDISPVKSVLAQSPGTINPVTPVSCCGNDTITLSVSGSGTMLWYEVGSQGAFIVNTGPTLTDYFTATKTYSVGALSGNPESAGIVDTLTGTPVNWQPIEQGVRIRTTQPGYLSTVTIYPQSTGNVNVFLRQVGSSLISSLSYNVTAANAPWVLPLDLYLNANIEYDIVFSCPFNITGNCGGFTYPLTSSGGSFEIMGAINQNTFSTDSCNNFIYDLQFLQGCRSALVPVTVNYFPAISGILTAQGPTSFCQGGSVTLHAAPTGGYNYSWYRNGVVIPNATTNNLLVTQAGNYASRIYNLNCSDTTSPIRVTIPCITQSDPEEKSYTNLEPDGESVFLLYQSDADLVLTYDVAFDSENTIQICDMSGRILTNVKVQDLKGLNKRDIDVSDFSRGCYIIRWISQEGMKVRKWIRY